jgi:hypothetical protein
MLVDYEDSEEEAVVVPKKKVKTVDIQQLMAISKKVKTNDGHARIVDRSDDDDDAWDPDGGTIPKDEPQ